MIERVSAPEARRRLGVYDTPAPLASALVRFAGSFADRVPELVADPSCGSGRFLIAAADHLVEGGVPPGDVCRRLVGFDLDPGAVADARAELTEWCRRHHLADHHAAAADLRVLDALVELPADLLGRVDLVVGNPPFLAQTARATRRTAQQRRAVAQRLGSVAPLADTAALFLLLAVDLLRDGGVATLIQPSSFLSARDAAAIRERLLDHARLAGLWGSDEPHFDAEVEVCAPVVVVGGHRSPAPVRVVWGRDAAPADTLDPPVGPASWGPLLARAFGVPVVPAARPGRPSLGTVAAVTAGFRDEFYALSAAAVDVGDPGYDESAPPLVTVGMIDPARNTWGVRNHRLAGRQVLAPRVDRSALRATAPAVDTWVDRRLRPKVLVATQTRVVEALADPAGRLVPVTPTLSVEPHVADDVWAVLAVLLTPVVSARLAAEHLGSGRGPRALRLSASSLAAVPLPDGPVSWRRGAVLARRLSQADGGTRTDLLARLGRTMADAEPGLPADVAAEVLEWWMERARRT